MSLGQLTLVQDRNDLNEWRVVDVTNHKVGAIRPVDTRDTSGLWRIVEAVDVGEASLTDHFLTRDKAFAAFQQHLLKKMAVER